MAPMSEPTEPTAVPPQEPTPGESERRADPTPGESGPPPGRRLEAPPSRRFAAGGPTGTGVESIGSPERAVLMGVVGAAIGVAVFLVLAIGFSYSAGLLIVSVFTGRFIGLFVRAGAAGTVSSPARVVIAVLVFLVAQTAAILVTWLWSHAEGGDLGLPDYLDQAYGTPLIALEFMLGTLMAWWSAR